MYGTVNTVTIVTDQNTGESKCYGFVTMTDQAGAQRAIAALDGSSIGERRINVRLTEEKKKLHEGPIHANMVKRSYEKTIDQVQKVDRFKRPRRFQ